MPVRASTPALALLVAPVPTPILAALQPLAANAKTPRGRDALVRANSGLPIVITRSLNAGTGHRKAELLTTFDLCTGNFDSC